MLADVASGGGQTVDKKILFASPEWFDAVHHACLLYTSLSPGFRTVPSVFALSPGSPPSPT